MRYGDKLEALLRLQDEQTRKLTVELNDLREKTGGRSSVPPASFVGLSESAAAKELIRELNQFGEREDKYQTLLGANARGALREIRADFGQFSMSPIEGFYATRIGTQSIDNNTETAITFNATSSYGTNHFSQPYTDGAKIKVKTPNRTIGVFGTIEWATNATGRRGLHINFYDKDDVLLTGLTLHSFAAFNEGTTLPFAGGLWLPHYTEDENYPTLDYLKLTCIQTSGGALNVNNVRAYFFCLK